MLTMVGPGCLVSDRIRFKMTIGHKGNLEATKPRISLDGLRPGTMRQNPIEVYPISLQCPRGLLAQDVADHPVGFSSQQLHITTKERDRLLREMDVCR